MFLKTKTLLKSKLPRPVYESLRVAKNPGDVVSALRFVRNPSLDLSLGTRVDVIRRIFQTTFSVECPHTQEEVLSFMEVVFALPDSVPGCVVEAGCYKGGSTAKFSLAAKLVDRKLVVFDSFEGIPSNEENHGKNIFGDTAEFGAGSYRGGLDEVRGNVRRYGELDVCTFVKGWFDDTLPSFREPIAALYIDVDLASSTKTCIKYLYPLLQSGGVLFSQDGHLPLVIDVFEDDEFWEKEVGCQRPAVKGLRTSKLIRVDKA